MTEKELIKKIRELRQIQPRKDWVVLTKREILGDSATRPRNLFAGILEIFPRFFFQYKPAFATLIVLGILIGAFSFVQNSLPGDLLYPIKKITERSQAIFVSENEKPKLNLELANKRLEELNEIVQTNRVKKLAPAINEFQASVSEVAKNFLKKEGAASDPAAIKKLVELEKSKQIAEQILATQIETEDLDNTYKAVAETLISDLETRSLTEEKEEVLDQMKELAAEGRYFEVLELLPLINQ